MGRNANRLLFAGVVLLLVSVGLAWFGFTTNNRSPVPSLSSLGLAIVSFGLACYLISRGLRRLGNIQSTQPLRKLGTGILIIGAALTIYAAIAFFLLKNLPPNNGTGRLPSFYLLSAGMAVMLVGTVVRNFRLR